MSINQFEENGDTYFQLFASCPVCHNQGRNAPRLFWTHGDNNCHGDIYVGDNAYYKCRKCGQTSHVSKLMLSCPRCSNATNGIWELKAGSSDSSALIGFIGQMVQACGLPWLQKFIVNMDCMQNGHSYSYNYSQGSTFSMIYFAAVIVNLYGIRI